MEPNHVIDRSLSADLLTQITKKSRKNPAERSPLDRVMMLFKMQVLQGETFAKALIKSFTLLIIKD